MTSLLRKYSQVFFQSCLQNRLRLKECDLTLDIPPEFGSTSKYCATLGHKINHSFEPNAEFVKTESARYIFTSIY
jgi:hypothetical protein